MKTRLATSFIALSTAFAAPALADVTASDVLSNQQAFFTAMGVSLNGELSGDTLSNPEVNIIFPMGVASLQVTTKGDLVFADNGDGSVLISYPSPMGLTLSGGAQGEGSFTIAMTMTHEGYSVVASGDPGNITYEADARNVSFEFVDAMVDDPMMDEMDVAGTFTMESWTGTSTVTEANLIGYTSSSEVGATTADFSFMVDGVESTTVQNTQPVQTNVDLTLPVGGSNLMNLSDALRDGLNLVLKSTGGGSTSVAQTTLNGEPFGTQKTSTGPQVFSVLFNEDGIDLSGEAADFAMTFNDPMVFPGDIDVAMETISMAYDLPLNASEDPQDFRVATSLQGFTLGDTVWNLFDPAGILPRDPAEITFDVTGTGTTGTDFLDFMALAEMFGPPQVEVSDVTIENLRIAAVGAEATATGAMTFDWTDFQTIPGIARPEGQVTVNLSGANALMDNLVAMGLIPEEELMMPRMMMGMFATPIGDDMLESVLEVNSEGHVLANGQRLQ